MADLDIYYKGNKIFTADDDVRESLNTAGTYCEEDIIVDYKKHPLPSLSDPASASDILNGKEAIDGQGQKITGTLVPPVDTGAGGLYKMIVQGETLPAVVEDEGITKINSASRTYVINIQGVRELRLPNCNSLGTLKIFYGDSALSILELGANLNVTSTTSSTGLGFISFASAPKNLKVIGINTLGQYSGIGLAPISHIWFCDVKRLSNAALYNAGVGTKVRTITFDTLTSFDGQTNFTSGAHSTLSSIIIRTPTLCTLSRGFTSTSDITAQFTKFYVPVNLLTQYSSATNWTTYYNRGQIVGIDEDTTATVGTQFTPTTTETVDHWDQVDLQSYSVGTIDTTNGSITPTHDGRLLIRGLDANDEIVHVTYLQIGTGFDEEANLA